MLILALTAGFVGFVHSLAPGHWLPIVLMVKSRKWGDREAVLGALVAAAGHVVTSGGLGILALLLGNAFFKDHLFELEEHAGAILVVFGLLYAGYARTRHRHCHGHEHHGPVPQTNAAPYWFLFSVGLSPCFAALPIFATAAGGGAGHLAATLATFAVGVSAAFIVGSLLTSKGLVKLDHPILEHHGDVITGLGVAVMGAILLFFPHTHVH